MSGREGGGGGAGGIASAGMVVSGTSRVCDGGRGAGATAGGGAGGRATTSGATSTDREGDVSGFSRAARTRASSSSASSGKAGRVDSSIGMPGRVSPSSTGPPSRLRRVGWKDSASTGPSRRMVFAGNIAPAGGDGRGAAPSSEGSGAAARASE
ncbi:hypothetical protein M0222_13120 [Myxococcus fulvus]|nr:hypothetical protein [Myxococcus fulvus]MCK8498727.1 hypothetical protein [Myxococcus fulvus]